MIDRQHPNSSARTSPRYALHPESNNKRTFWISAPVNETFIVSVAIKHQDTVVLIVSHILNKAVAGLFDDLRNDCTPRFDVRYLCDNSRGKFNKFRLDSRYTLFTINDLANLDYPGKRQLGYSETPKKRAGYHKDRNFTMGNTELALLWFYRNNPDFRHYWLIEYDVRFSGSWQSLFSHFASSRADLLATSLAGHQESPGWTRWKSMRLADKAIEQRDFVRGFFPIFRISNAALRQLDIDYRSGVSGHYECLMPTILHHAGYVLEDIGGDGSFVRDENINRFYLNNRTSNSLAPGTFIFRPGFDQPGDRPNTLWHPVKYRPLWRRIAGRIWRKLRGLSASIASR